MNSRANLSCPQCHQDLAFLCTLQAGWGNSMDDWDTYDVGKCPKCFRNFHRNRTTGEYKPLPWEPQCPECNEAARFHAVDQALTLPKGDPSGLIYACPNHPERRWTRNPEGDQWVVLS